MSGTRGWRSSQRQSSSGAIDSEQSVVAPYPVVSESEQGAVQLGARYWLEVERFARGLVHARERAGRLELRLLGGGPVLLCFGPPRLDVVSGSVACRYAIEGGLLARRPGGEISFFQTVASEVELRSAIRGFFPALAARPGRPSWSGGLYSQVQRRLHLAISRRYFRALIGARGR